MLSLAEIAVVLFLAAQEPAVPEGVTVLEAPADPAGGGLKPGDVLLSINGRKEASLTDYRRRLAESLETPLKARVLREGNEISVEWKVARGSYRLTDWPGPEEQFRRDHATALGEVGVQAGMTAIRAVLQGNGRVAQRQLVKARDGGVKDPLLDWAEGYLKARYLNEPVEAATLLARAQEASDKRAGPDGKRVSGWCHVASGYREFLHRRDAEATLREIQAARSCGVDVSELSRAVAAWLPRGSEQAGPLRRQIFADDPLDVATGRLLAESAPTAEEGRRYAEAVRRLSGESGDDPRLELMGLLQRLKSDQVAAGAVEDYVREHSRLTPVDVALAKDGLADHGRRTRDSEREFRLRVEALQVSPSVERARAMGRAARECGKMMLALEALGALRSARLSPNTQREYHAIESELLWEAYRSEGVPVLEESLRLRRLGRLEEAIEFLTERAGSLLQPELKVAAGLMLQEAGETKELASYFQPETEFLMKHPGGDAEESDFPRVLLLEARTRASSAVAMRRLEQLADAPGREGQATVRAAHASILFNEGKKTAAIAKLREAVQALAWPDSGKSWLPIYAEGRLCSEPRDYIEALNAAWEAGVAIPPAVQRR